MGWHEQEAARARRVGKCIMEMESNKPIPWLEEFCESCYYWGNENSKALPIREYMTGRLEGSTTVGTCRRYPPRDGKWPEMHCYHPACGEYFSIRHARDIKDAQEAAISKCEDGD